VVPRRHHSLGFRFCWGFWELPVFLCFWRFGVLVLPGVLLRPVSGLRSWRLRVLVSCFFLVFGFFGSAVADFVLYCFELCFFLFLMQRQGTCRFPSKNRDQGSGMHICWHRCLDDLSLFLQFLFDYILDRFAGKVDRAG
jgi:hypothetical protein